MRRRDDPLSITMAVRLDQEAVRPGEKLSFTIVAQNHCSSNVLRMEMKMTQLTTWVAHNRPTEKKVRIGSERAASVHRQGARDRALPDGCDQRRVMESHGFVPCVCVSPDFGSTSYSGIPDGGCLIISAADG